MLKQRTPLKRKTPLKAKKNLIAKTPLKVKGSRLPDDVPQWNGLKRSPLKAKIKKTPKRISILTDNMDRCYICGKSSKDTGRKIEIHEIYFGSFRNKSIEYGCTVPLCNEDHTGTNGVHHNRELNIRLKKECQIKFEELYSHDEFMNIFTKNYL